MPRASRKFISPGFLEPGAVPLNVNSDAPPVTDEQYVQLARAAYKRNEPVDGFTISPEGSDRNRTVFVKNGTQHHVVAFSGTRLSGSSGAKWRDLGNNALLALGLSKLGARHRSAVALTKELVDKHGKENVSTVGHSAGGHLALVSHQATRTSGDDAGIHARALNPGFSPLDAKRSRYLLAPLSHLVPGYSLLSQAVHTPVKLGDNAHVKAVRGDIISSVSPHIDASHVEIIDKKFRDPHALANFE